MPPRKLRANRLNTRLLGSGVLAAAMLVITYFPATENILTGYVMGGQQIGCASVVDKNPSDRVISVASGKIRIRYGSWATLSVGKCSAVKVQFPDYAEYKLYKPWFTAVEWKQTVNSATTPPQHYPGQYIVGVDLMNFSIDSSTTSLSDAHISLATALAGLPQMNGFVGYLTLGSTKYEVYVDPPLPPPPPPCILTGLSNNAGNLTKVISGGADVTVRLTGTKNCKAKVTVPPENGDGVRSTYYLEASQSGWIGSPGGTQRQTELFRSHDMGSIFFRASTNPGVFTISTGVGVELGVYNGNFGVTLMEFDENGDAIKETPYAFEVVDPPPPPPSPCTLNLPGEVVPGETINLKIDGGPNCYVVALAWQNQLGRVLYKLGTTQSVWRTLDEPSMISQLPVSKTREDWTKEGLLEVTGAGTFTFAVDPQAPLGAGDPFQVWEKTPQGMEHVWNYEFDIVQQLTQNDDSGNTTVVTVSNPGSNLCAPAGCPCSSDTIFTVKGVNGIGGGTPSVCADGSGTCGDLGTIVKMFKTPHPDFCAWLTPNPKGSPENNSCASPFEFIDDEGNRNYDGIGRAIRTAFWTLTPDWTPPGASNPIVVVGNADNVQYELIEVKGNFFTCDGTMTFTKRAHIPDSVAPVCSSMPQTITVEAKGSSCAAGESSSSSSREPATPITPKNTSSTTTKNTETTTTTTSTTTNEPETENESWPPEEPETPGEPRTETEVTGPGNEPENPNSPNNPSNTGENGGGGGEENGEETGGGGGNELEGGFSGSCEIAVIGTKKQVSNSTKFLASVCNDYRKNECESMKGVFTSSNCVQYYLQSYTKDVTAVKTSCPWTCSPR